MQTVLSVKLLLSVMPPFLEAKLGLFEQVGQDQKYKSAQGGRMQHSPGWWRGNGTGILLLSCSITACQ